MLSKVFISLAIGSYLWLCSSWFDHEIRLAGLAETPPWIPGALFLVAAAGMLRRRRPSLGTDTRLALALALGALLTRLPLVFEAYGLFSSDAATQGVMALHLLEGRHHPVFLYNWSYIGSSKAHLTAALALVVRDPVTSFALAAALVYGALAGSVYLFARTMLSRAESIAAGLYIVFAPGFLTAWGMGNEGSYPDVLVLGTLMLWIGALFLKSEIGEDSAAFRIGLLGGLAFWVHILATYYLVAAVVLLAAHRFGKSVPRRLGVFTLGFALGDFPGILWNITHDFLSFRWWALDAAGPADGVSRVGRAVAQLGAVFETSLPVLAGFWPRDDPPSPEGAFRILLLLLFPSAFALFAWKHRRELLELGRGRLTPPVLALGFTVLVVALFVQSSFGWMTDEPRYLLFLFSVLPLFLASALSTVAARSRIAAGLAASMLLFLGARGYLLYYQGARESDASNREFLGKLEELDIRHVHSDYHLSYKYVFLSHGRMVWTSALGPSRTEWYPGFREEVEKAPDAALVPRSFRMAKRIERRLEERNVRYRREDLLYPVLFDFSEPVPMKWLVP